MHVRKKDLSKLRYKRSSDTRTTQRPEMTKSFLAFTKGSKERFDMFLSDFNDTRIKR